MTSCTNCGNELGVGRFCMNCGHPIEWRTDTAERPAVPPPPAPPAEPTPGVPPPPPRFPLFADEVPPSRRPTEQPPAPIEALPDEPATHRRPAGPWVIWLAVAVVLTLVAGAGVWLLTRDDDTDPASAQNAPAASNKPGKPSDPTSSAPQLEPGELAPRSDVEVPATAEPNQDVSGNEVRYDGVNLLDGVPETCWRMPGDGTGDEIVVTLPAETRLASVGIINGYAKSAQDAQGRELDWYHGNRRVLTVEWVFDDGSTLIQDLDDTTEMQSVDVDATTTTITVRLVKVSAPGEGPASRNFTAISDLSFVSR